jgi:hypothetical protein
MVAGTSNTKFALEDVFKDVAFQQRASQQKGAPHLIAQTDHAINFEIVVAVACCILACCLVSVDQSNTGLCHLLCLGN